MSSPAIWRKPKGSKDYRALRSRAFHEEYIRTLVPLLEDGMVIHTFTDNYASLLIRKYMRETGVDKDVIVGGWSSVSLRNPNREDIRFLD